VLPALHHALTREIAPRFGHDGSLSCKMAIAVN